MNMFNLFVVVAVLLVIAVVLFLLNKKRREDSKKDEVSEEDKVPNTTLTQHGVYQRVLAQNGMPYDSSHSTTSQSEPQVPVVDESVKQQGQEEYDQVNVSQTQYDESFPTLTDALKKAAQDVVKDEAAKPVKTLEEKLSYPYYFHSKPLENANRYSVVGTYKKIDEKDDKKQYPSGYKLVLGYAVCSEQDKFNREIGRHVATDHMNDPKKQYVFPVTEEELQYPGKTFGEFAKTLVPITVFGAVNRSAIHHYFSDPEGYKWDDTPSKHDKKVHNKYLKKLKEAPYRLLMVKVKSIKCDFCGVYELYPVDLCLMVDDESEDNQATQVSTTQDTHTEQSI